MPSLIAPSDTSATGDNVVSQFNAILTSTPLPAISTLDDITPSLLLDLYELLFRLKLPYATPRDLSHDSQLRNIRVLIGHIAHDILKMDLSFLEPHKICNRDEQALGDFLRIFLGVARLRKAHLERSVGGSENESVVRHEQQVVAGDNGGRGGGWGEDNRSLDGSEHTIRATPRRENIIDIRRKHDTRVAVRSNTNTPRRTVTVIKKTPSKPRLHDEYVPALYTPSRHLEITETDLSSALEQVHAAAPPSEASSVPSDFIHNVNERVSNIWSRLNSRTNRHISDKMSERPSSHSPRRPLSVISQDSNLPAVLENETDELHLTPLKPRPIPPSKTQPANGHTLAEPTPYLKAWLDTAGIDNSNSSHKPRSNQTTPEKHTPLPSTRTAPANFKEPSFASPEESPLARRHRPAAATTRSKSSQQILHSQQQRTPPKFSLRRRSTEPPALSSSPVPSREQQQQQQHLLNIDVAKAMFSNSPIKLSGRSSVAKKEAADEGNSSNEEEDDIEEEDDEVSDTESASSSIATSALSVSSVEWSDTASIAALRKIRLEALEEAQALQEKQKDQERQEEEKLVTSTTSLVRANNNDTRLQKWKEEEEDDEYYDDDGSVGDHGYGIHGEEEVVDDNDDDAESSRKRIMHAHGRRRSSIPSTFMHHRQHSPEEEEEGKHAQSTVSYETISPNSSASVAAERWKARWRAEGGVVPGTAGAINGSPVPRRPRHPLIKSVNGYHQPQPQHQRQNGNHQRRHVEGVRREEEAVEDCEDALTTRNTEDLEMELKGLEGVGLSESKRQIMLFERLIRRAVDKKVPGEV
ncbi:hypothetical protein ABW20_dc0109205 [Dactylellina cionopaga]|nr:hypothetical protein ABW20_dc0109205 [Dactylellina cionopaga]